MKSSFRHLAALPVFAFALSFLGACSSTPTVTSPDWIRQPTRTVDGGYIVYIGDGEDTTIEKAEFKAESQALQDLANECSFLSKGARVEDRYHDASHGHVTAFAKVGIAIQDCDAAKSANTAEDIRKLGNPALTAQLKRYQDLVDDPADDSDLSNGKPMNPMLASTSVPANISDPDDYFIARHRIAYVKQEIILMPEPVYTTYVTRSAAAPAVNTQLQTAAANVKTFEQKNPQTKTWSKSWSDFERNTPKDLPRNIPRRKGRTPKIENAKPKKEKTDLGKAQTTQPNHSGHKKRMRQKNPS